MRMSNVVNLKEYREAKLAKSKSQLDVWAELWVRYWFILAGIY